MYLRCGALPGEGGQKVAGILQQIELAPIA